MMRRLGTIAPCVILVAALAGCDARVPVVPDGRPVADSLVFTQAELQALDSTGRAIVRANPANADLQSLVDSTLLVLTAGVQATLLNGKGLSGNFTNALLYSVGVHRVFIHSGGSSSTWTIVAMDDPVYLQDLIEVSAFAQNGSTTPPASVHGTIGDGAGIVNGMLLRVGANGAVTQWRANAGTVQIASDTPGAPCPNFTPTAIVTCTLETMHVSFSMTGPDTAGGGSPRSAGVATVDIPAMRLTYAF
jgi:hypothetical protein